jgi:RNA polymerase sigma-70 factor, ECF subfamily
MTLTDSELVARTRRRDMTAFETLMRRHFRMAFIIAYAHLNNRADAEEVCQEAFFRVWQRIDDCREPARVGAWIAAVVRNTAHNLRDARRVRETEVLESAALVPARHRADIGMERGELRAHLWAALKRLSPTQREVVLLHDLEGWKHAEIGQRLGISEVMSRRHLSDGRRALRAVLGDVLPTLELDHD